MKLSTIKKYFSLYSIVLYIISPPGPGFDSTSPANISSSFLQGAVRREGASSPTVPPPPLPLDTHSEKEKDVGTF